jgi:superfamily II DNA/RNA helicase
MSFNDLGLSDKVVSAVAASGYTTPTLIQEQAIPHVLARRDVLGIAQTGTGKTAAFTLPMLTMLEQGRARARMPRTLILEPTRELAAQVEEAFIKYGVNHKLSVALLIGGMSFGDQDAKINRGVDVLIATPGRLLDHFERGKLLMTGVELLVIDEADRMLDMGFIPDIERICKMVPFTRQTLFFTATMPPEITRITEQFLHNPVRIESARPSSTAATITQRLVATHAKDFEKRETLRGLLRDAVDLKNAIVFCNRKSEVATLHKSLVKHNFPAVALHGDMDQRSRMAALDSFRKGEMTILVASDVAARGLDIPDVSHVYNYDVPFHAEDYVHRIGRTGRAGRLGTAITLVTRNDDKALSAIVKLITQPIEWHGPALGDLPASTATSDGPDHRRSGRDRGAERGRGGKPRPGSRDSSDHAKADAPQREPETAERPSESEPQERAAPRPRRERNERPSRERAPEAVLETVRAVPERNTARRPVRDNDDGPTPLGLGDHMPAFLMRPTKRG